MKPFLQKRPLRFECLNRVSYVPADWISLYLDGHKSRSVLSWQSLQSLSPGFPSVTISLLISPVTGSKNRLQEKQTG